MALGDCYSVECASPLDFESVLVGLFAENPSGCVGIKIHLDLLSDPEEPCVTLSLQELIMSSLVEDGAGGYALRLIGVTGPPSCYPCAQYDDIESLIKSLFAKQDDCYALKYYAGDSDCTGLESFAKCSASLTWEQLLRQAIGHDDVNGNYLIVNQLSGNCDSINCDINLTWSQLFAGLIQKETAECYGIFNLISVDNRHTETSVQECGKYLSFEEVFKAAITEVPCGYALNVLIISLAQ